MVIDKGIDGKWNGRSKKYDKSCPNCKVNLAEYIDKCKIPCKNCRDPAWKCPQDVGKNKIIILVNINYENYEKELYRTGYFIFNFIINNK